MTQYIEVNNKNPKGKLLHRQQLVEAKEGTEQVAEIYPSGSELDDSIMSAVNPKMKSFTDFIQLPYLRLFEKDIQRNDVVVFNYPLSKGTPIDHRALYIKRCIALPGDTFQLKNKATYINNKLVKSPELIEHNYNVSSNIQLTNDTLLKYQITEGGNLGSNFFWQLTLSNWAKEQLNQSAYIASIQPITMNKSGHADYLFPTKKKHRKEVLLNFLSVRCLLSPSIKKLRFVL